MYFHHLSSVVAQLWALIFVTHAEIFATEMYVNHVTLRQTLLKHYDPLVIPTKTGSGTVSVTMTMYIQNVQRFDESAHTLSSIVTWDIYWMDSHLSWNKTEYDGVNSIYMKASTVWIPDIFITNAVEDQRLQQEDDILQVWSSGEVMWIPMRKLDTVCELNVQAYPFDTQKCHIEVEGWIHDIDNIMLKPEGKGYSFSYYTPNSAWEFKSVSIFSYNKTAARVGYSRLRWTIILERRWPYHMLIVFFPVLVVMILNMMSIIIPDDSGEKLGYSVNLFLTLIVCLSFISGIMPSTSENIPYISILVSYQVFTSSLVVACSCLVAYLNKIGERNDTFDNRFLYRLCCLRYDDRNHNVKMYLLLGQRLNRITALFCIFTNCIALVIYFCFALTHVH